MRPIPLVLAAAAAAVLAGCATPAADVAAGGGRHLVYVDAAGQPVRQFTYPDAVFCQRVEPLAGAGARCRAEPAPGLQAQATLRYSPPGIVVEGRYTDLARCRADTASMSPGVQLVSPCVPV